MVRDFVDWVEIIGTVIIAGAYFIVSNDFLKANQERFNFFNLNWIDTNPLLLIFQSKRWGRY